MMPNPTSLGPRKPYIKREMKMTAMISFMLLVIMLIFAFGTPYSSYQYLYLFDMLVSIALLILSTGWPAYLTYRVTDPASANTSTGLHKKMSIDVCLAWKDAHDAFAKFLGLEFSTENILVRLNFVLLEIFTNNFIAL